MFTIKINRIYYSDKYPNEGEFESFLSQQGGAANAYTDMQVSMQSF